MKKTIMAATLALAAFALVAQGRYAWVDSFSEDGDGILPGVDPQKVVGSIVTAGSSTVYPLSEALAERFKKEGFGGQISIDSIGSGAGFERFTVTGEIDISNASARIKPSNIEAAAKLRPPRLPIEFRVGTDALAVVVSAKNEFVKELTVKELGLVFSTAHYWSEVRPSWPKKEIKRFSPGTDSGTFDYFVEQVFKKDKKPLLGAAGIQLSEDDNVLAQGIAGDAYAIGYFGYAYAAENRGKIRPIAIEGVEPSQASVDAGSYPLARPLFLYSDAGIIRDKPQVAAFLTYYLTYVNDLIRKVGYFPAPAAELRKSKTLLAEAMRGRY